MLERMYTRKQVSEITGIPLKTLDFWAYTKPEKLPYFRMGKRSYYKESTINAFIEQHRVEA